MDWHSLHKLVKDLTAVRAFLFEIARKQEYCELAGLGEVNKIDGCNQAIGALKTLETQLSILERSSRFTAPELHEKIKSITNESPIASRAAEISLAIEISESRRLRRGLVSWFESIAGGLNGAIGLKPYKNVFSSDGEIPLKKMLVDLDRLLPLAKAVESTAWKREQAVTETFKPAGIDPEKVLFHIEQAIRSISEEARLGNDEREKLEEYLLEAQSELAKSDPAWRKIVGALVIVSTILGGLAVAPEALNNVNYAVKYLLGTTFEGVSFPSDHAITQLPATSET